MELAWGGHLVGHQRQKEFAFPGRRKLFCGAPLPKSPAIKSLGYPVNMLRPPLTRKMIETADRHVYTESP
jgi:hypothetical protein